MVCDSAAGEESPAEVSLSVSRRRRRVAELERWLPCGLFAVACAAFLLTSSAGSYEEAASGAAGGLLGHPLWGAVACALARLPPRADGLVRLVCALCGGLAVAYACRVASRLFQCLLNPQLGLGLAPDTEPAGEATPAPAAAAGAAAALALAFSLPFWAAAASMSPRLVEVLLLLAVLDLLLRFAATEQPALGLVALGLCGVGLVESPALLPLLPVAVVLALQVAVRSDANSELLLPMLTLSLLAGAALAFGLWLALESPALNGAAGHVAEGARRFLGAYIADARATFLSAGFFQEWFVPALSLFGAFLCVRTIVFNEGGLGGAGWALVVLTTAAALSALLGRSASAGALLKGGGGASAMPAAMLAFVVGAVVAGGFTLMASFGGDSEEDRPPAFAKAAVCVLIGGVTLALLFAPAVSFAELKALRKTVDARAEAAVGSPTSAGPGLADPQARAKPPAGRKL